MLDEAEQLPDGSAALIALMDYAAHSGPTANAHSCDTG
jgi:hypothetical protein